MFLDNRPRSQKTQHYKSLETAFQAGPTSDRLGLRPPDATKPYLCSLEGDVAGFEESRTDLRQ
jgi:hypothetical protein